MFDETELDHIRATAEGVLERARNDEAFLAELRANPEQVLTDAGVPAEVIGEIVEDRWGLVDVSGYRPKDCRYTCDNITCIKFVTVCGAVPYTN